MRQVRAWCYRFLGIFGKERRDREFAEELESHLQMHIEDGIRSGMTPAEARRVALIKLGGIEPAKEIYRDRRGLPWLETLARDVAYGFRMMRRSPGFTATVILTLALGIGATTAIFTVVSGVLLRPLPFREPERLVSIREEQTHGLIDFIGSTEVVEWMKHSRTMSGIGAYFDCSVNLVGPQEAEHLDCAHVTASLFHLLGVPPVIGRNFLPEEDRPGGPLAVILSHSFWKQRFGGDTSILGKSLTLDDKSYTVVGVLPDGFQIPDRFRIPQDIWLPFQLQEDRAKWTIVWAVGRLRPDVSLNAAQQELDAMLQALRRYRGTVRVSLANWQEQITGGVKKPLVIFLAAVGFVLLIACLNVANLLLVRAAGRETEIAVRRALGAGKSRILRQLLTESILLALGGSALGLVLAFFGKDLLVAFLSRNLPTVPPIPLDVRVLAFNFAVALVSGVAFGIFPALEASRLPLNESLKQSGRWSGGSGRPMRVRNVLAVAEVALAMALLIAAGLLFRSFLRMRGMDSDLAADRILTMNLQLKGARHATQQDQAEFFHQALARIRVLPGVQSAAASSGGWASTEIEGRPDVEAEAAWSIVTTDYFRTVGIPLLSGRDFADSDTRGAPEVVIVSQSFARRYFPHENCLGRRLASWYAKNAWMTIVGVVGERRSTLDQDPQPTLYNFYLQAGEAGAGEMSMDMVVRTAGDPMKLASAVRGQIASVDRTQAPTGIMTLEQRLAEQIAPRKVNLLLLGTFATLALILGAVGIYGVVSHSVSRRTHEIGVRIALGAGKTDVIKLIVGRGLVLVAMGEAVGLVTALALNRVIASMLFHITTSDAMTYCAVAVIWLVVGAAACYIPARRAMKLDTADALRCE